MKPLLAALVLLAAVAPSRAQDFMGMTPDDAAGLVAQARAQQHEERLRALGWEPSSLPSLGKALGWRVSLASAQNCVYDAVAERLRADPSADVQYPDVLYAGDVDLSGYQAAYKGQFPSASVPSSVRTVYMPNYDVIYVDDSAGDYKGASTIDAALAAQYARFIDGAVLNVSDPAKIDADSAAVRSWYETRYPAGASSCGS